MQGDKYMTFMRYLFEVFPYLAILCFIIGTLLRYFRWPFSVTSLSSQFLESRTLFWGSVPWHYGLILVLFGHLVIFFAPDTIFKLAESTSQMQTVETIALAAGLLCLFGLLLLLVRRIIDKRIWAVTSVMDIFLLCLLFLQALSGVLTAIFYRWGASWFAATLTPYLWSLIKLSPDATHVSSMPFLVQFHILMAFFTIAIIPYSRLIHLIVAPLDYLWRPIQVVVWNRKA